MIFIYFKDLNFQIHPHLDVVYVRTFDIVISNHYHNHIIIPIERETRQKLAEQKKNMVTVNRIIIIIILSQHY